MQQQASTAAQDHRHLQHTWVSWRKLVGAGYQIATTHHRCRLLNTSVATWLQLPAANLRLRAISAAVSSVYSQLLQQ